MSYGFDDNMGKVPIEPMLNNLQNIFQTNINKIYNYIKLYLYLTSFKMFLSSILCAASTTGTGVNALAFAGRSSCLLPCAP